MNWKKILISNLVVFAVMVTPCVIQSYRFKKQIAEGYKRMNNVPLPNIGEEYLKQHKEFINNLYNPEVKRQNDIIDRYISNPEEFF